MHLFFVSQREGNLLRLSEEESWHCAKVMRMQAGELVVLLDGNGSRYHGKLTEVHHKNCIAEIIEVAQVIKRDRHLHIAVAPTKNMDRMEWFAEKATELSVEEISFITCKNSERKQINTERIKKIVMSAMKQSGQAYLPTVHESISFSQFLSQAQSSSAKKLIAHCATDTEKLLLHQITSHHLIVLIGPEGDFTAAEINEANQNGFIPVSLGDARLRTETAAMYVAATFH